MTMLTVKNWENFQHYKDRNPPWIKLHIELLNSMDWVMLDDASKLLAVVCMMIASRNQGQVPNNPAYLKKVAHLDKLPNLKPLIDIGFLVDASNTLADASTLQADAIIEERRGEDIEQKRKVELILPEWVNQETWQDFVQMRKSIKKPLTEAAIKLILKDLEKFKLEGINPNLCLQESIKNSWQGVFKPKYAKPEPVKPKRANINDIMKAEASNG
jgi:hypothetical protein